jgi:hypothetical protein
VTMLRAVCFKMAGRCSMICRPIAGCPCSVATTRTGSEGASYSPRRSHHSSRRSNS